MERTIGPTQLAALVGQRPADRPAYGWLAERIARLVTDGQLTHDTRLPGERDAAAALGCSRTTVTHAYGLLRERGFVASRQGSGTRVTVPGGPVHGGGEPLASSGGLHGGRVIGPDEIDLTNAAPPAVEGLAEHYLAAVEQLGSYTHGSGYHQGGIPVLRQAIADRYTERGVPTDPDQILVTTGALAAVAATAHALLRRGDRVVAEASGYPNTLATLRGLGVRLYPAPEGPAGLDVASFTRDSAALRPRAMLVMPDFHNPTGRLLDDAGRAALGEAWNRNGVIGIVDETLVDLWWDVEPDVRPMAAYAANCVSVGSASKTYWGGLRLGWVRAPHSLIGAIAATRLTLDLGAPVLEQIVLARLLRDHPGIGDRRRAQLSARRVLLRDAIRQACPGWRCDLPPGGLSLWWQLPGPTSSEIAMAAGRRGLALPPGSTFALDGRGLTSRLRTPFTADEEDLRRAAGILGEVAALIG